MSQSRSFSWTNANPAVARNLDVGFTVAKITTIDVTNGGSWQWVTGMTAGYVLDVDSGAITTSNGFTPLSESANFGAAISAFSNASPGVITVDDSTVAGFAIGDTIKVAALADDGAAADSLNGTYTIASLTATALTLNEATNATHSAYVSGGFVTRVSDVNGNPIPTENFARRGMTVGTTPVGAASAVMVAIVEGMESVV